jgi:hypothetical protein
VILKEARSGGAWEWHQDYGYWHHDGFLFPNMLSAFVALDPSTRENGCLQVLRGSHQMGRLGHGRAGGQMGTDPSASRRSRSAFERVHVEMTPVRCSFSIATRLHTRRPTTATITGARLSCATPAPATRSIAATSFKTYPVCRLGAPDAVSRFAPEKIRLFLNEYVQLIVCSFWYVGCGFVAQNIHIPNFNRCRMRFSALAEARPELGQQVADYYGIPKVYASHQDIAADPDIEAVGVSGPYALQGAIAEDLLRAGKHVFMEKPMAVSVARAQGIVDAEKASGKRLMVGYMKRYDSGNILLKQQADAWRASGEAGNVVFARNHGFGGNWVYAQDPNVKSFQAPAGAAAPPSPDECPDWLPDASKNAYLGYLQQWTHNVNLLRFFCWMTPQARRASKMCISMAMA